MKFGFHFECFKEMLLMVTLVVWKIFKSGQGDQLEGYCSS